MQGFPALPAGLYAGQRDPSSAVPRRPLLRYPGSGHSGRKIPMNEDERLQLLETVGEAHAVLSDVALELRRRLTSKAPVTKAAVKVEQEAFRLKRELGRLDLTEPDPAPRRGPRPEVRRGGKVIDIERLRRGKDRGGER